MEYVKIPYEKAREVGDLLKGNKDIKQIAAASALELVLTGIAEKEAEDVRIAGLKRWGPGSGCGCAGCDTNW